MKDIFEITNEFDNTAQIAALRTIANGACARTIRLIRSALREDPTAQVRDESGDKVDLDQRNENDIEVSNRKHDTEVSDGWGFDSDESPMEQAQTMHAVYDFALVELATITQNRFDMPMTPEAMGDFMAKAQARGADDSLIKQVADYVGVNSDKVKEMNEIQGMKAQERFLEELPEILSRFHDMKGNGYEGCFDDLSPIQQHQLGYKLCEGLFNAEAQALNRALRMNSVAVLSDIPILRQAYKIAYDWFDELERHHTNILAQAMENGMRPRIHSELPKPKEPDAK